MSKDQILFIVLALIMAITGHYAHRTFQRGQRILKQQNFYYMGKPRKPRVSPLRSLLPRLLKRIANPKKAAA